MLDPFIFIQMRLRSRLRKAVTVIIRRSCPEMQSHFAMPLIVMTLLADDPVLAQSTLELRSLAVFHVDCGGRSALSPMQLFCGQQFPFSLPRQ